MHPYCGQYCLIQARETRNKSSTAKHFEWVTPGVLLRQHVLKPLARWPLRCQHVSNFDRGLRLLGAEQQLSLIHTGFT